jgi:hypothetical protein
MQVDLIQYDWYPYQRLGQTCVPRLDHRKIQGKDSHLQTKKRLSEEINCQHLDLGLPASRIVRK